jgi:hypothetical protein
VGGAAQHFPFHLEIIHSAWQMNSFENFLKKKKAGDEWRRFPGQ